MLTSTTPPLLLELIYYYNDCIKPGDQYYAIGNIRKDGTKSPHLQPRCIPCHAIKTNAWKKANPLSVKRTTKKQSLKSLYGLAIKDYEDLLEKQAGRCKICARFRQLAVDHDHATGEVRGLLCTSCNNGLGRFEDDPERLRRAADYLE